LIASESGSVAIVPSDGFSADLEARLILDGVDGLEVGMADDARRFETLLESPTGLTLNPPPFRAFPWPRPTALLQGDIEIV
jgi:hypothetical protein